MLGLLVSVSVAAPPPELDLGRVDQWETAADRFLDLPTGCWEWVGRASWTKDRGPRGATTGETVFAGRTSEGTWSAVHLEPLGETQRESGTDHMLRVYDAHTAQFAPLFGNLAGGRVRVSGAEEDEGGEPTEDVEASNVLRKNRDRIGGDAETSWVEWDEPRGGVVLRRTFPLEQDPEAEVAVTVFFPNGGTVPTALDVVFPAVFKEGRAPRWSVREARIAMRAHIAYGEAFPASEAYSFTRSFLGVRVSEAQTIQYRHATRCPAPPAPSP